MASTLVLQDVAGVVVGIIVDAIQHEIVQIAARSVHGKGAAGVAIRGAGGAVDAAAVLGDLGDAGSKRGQLCVVPAIQGKVADLAAPDHIAKSRRFGLHQGHFSRDVDGLGHSADLQGEIDTQAVLHLQNDAGSRIELEALRFDGHRVAADLQGRDDIAARIIGVSGCFDIRANGGGGDGCAWNHCPARILHGADDGGGIHLSVQRAGHSHGQKTQTEISRITFHSHSP